MITLTHYSWNLNFILQNIFSLNFISMNFMIEYFIHYLFTRKMSMLYHNHFISLGLEICLKWTVKQWVQIIIWHWYLKTRQNRFHFGDQVDEALLITLGKKFKICLKLLKNKSHNFNLKHNYKYLYVILKVLTHK